MRRLGVRALLVAVGLALLGFYAAVATLGVRLLAALWAGRPPLATTLAVFLVVVLAGGYLSYRFGTAQVLRGLDAVELPRRRAPRLYRRLDALADRMAVGRPTLAVADVGGPRRTATVLEGPQ